MRLRTLALLFLLVAGLLAFIALYEGELPSSDDRLELAKRVLRFEPDEVRGLTLERGDSAVRFARVEAAAGAEDGEASWWLREPFDALADRSAVEELVDQLIRLEKGRTLEAIEPAELGLVDPRGRLALDTTDGPLELLIGSEVPAS